MKKVSSLTDKIISTCCGDTLNTYLSISRNWSHIIGEELSTVTSASAIKHRSASCHEYVLHINVIGSAALLVKSSESLILNRLKNFVKNRDVVTGIVIKHCSEINRGRILQIIERPKPVKKICELKEEKFKNSDLLKALESLKTEMQDAA